MGKINSNAAQNMTHPSDSSVEDTPYYPIVRVCDEFTGDRKAVAVWTVRSTLCRRSDEGKKIMADRKVLMGTHGSSLEGR